MHARIWRESLGESSRVRCTEGISPKQSLLRAACRPHSFHSSHAVSLPKLKIGLRCSSRNVILRASKRKSTKRASLTLKSTTCGTLEKMNTESQDVWTLAHTARLKRSVGIKTPPNAAGLVAKQTSFTRTRPDTFNAKFYAWTWLPALRVTGGTCIR